MRRFLFAALWMAAILMPHIAVAQLQGLPKSLGGLDAIPDLGDLKGANGIDLKEVQSLMGRAQAAKSGRGKLQSGDVGKALKMAQQLGMSPDDLAEKVHASQPGALGGMSKAELSKHIRALADKHGAKLKETPGRTKPRLRGKTTTHRKRRYPPRGYQRAKPHQSLKPTARARGNAHGLDPTIATKRPAKTSPYKRARAGSPSERKKAPVPRKRNSVKRTSP